MTKELTEAGAKDKALVRWMLTLVAYRMLAQSNFKAAIGKQVQAAKDRAFAGLSEEDLKPIILAGDIMEKLALKLARCKDIETLEQSVAYAESLLEGEVLVVQEDETLKPNV
ncbi:hypothetical protein BWI97_08800 [Siphonobacter sp. BAB-5405]|uniref:hypothetical protein n=1 Tax=Siphonobacter sp. BAB-5405 TaxID=1864825 RepID=UPI000C80780E|nr:hypothetical protein [Siphonobacter sp. BAB-5405]PMD97698.1 hypothetical protein BWI97_08800 [Siphonobacter sp. BAB-5405]